MTARAPHRSEVLRNALRREGLMRLAAVFVSFRISEIGAWIAITTVAHQRGGVNEASAVLVAQLAPAALLAAFVGSLISRWGPRLALTVGLGLQAVSLAVVAVLVRADAPSLVLYAVTVVAAISVVTTRPAVSTLLPEVVGDPHELTAANALVGWLDGLSTLIGPALTAIAFVTFGEWSAFVVFALFAALAGLVAAGVRVGAAPTAVPAADEELAEPDDDAASSWRSIRPVLAAIATHSFLIGALDLLFVVIAVDVTHGPAARAGWLATAFGLGTLVGGASSALLIGRARLWPAVVAAALGAAGMLALVGTTDASDTAAVALSLCGVGAAALMVSSRTLLQRVSDLRTLCRAFAAAESAEMSMLLLGSLAVPLFVSTLGAQWAPVGVAAVAAVAIALVARSMAAAERRVVVPLAEIELLRADELFSILPAAALETLARQAVSITVPAEAPIIQQGEVGDRYYVIVSGRVTVTIDGEWIRDEGPGEGFGELALLHDVPRTASVVAAEATELLSLDRESFLVAVTGHAPTAERASAVARGLPGSPVSEGGAG